MHFYHGIAKYAIGVASSTNESYMLFVHVNLKGYPLAQNLISPISVCFTACVVLAAIVLYFVDLRFNIFSTG
jgi:uncharacterized membrane protein